MDDQPQLRNRKEKKKKKKEDGWVACVEKESKEIQDLVERINEESEQLMKPGEDEEEEKKKMDGVSLHLWNLMLEEREKANSFAAILGKLHILTAKRTQSITEQADELRGQCIASLSMQREWAAACVKPRLWWLVVFFLFLLKLGAVFYQRLGLWFLAEVAFLNMWRELYGYNVKFSMILSTAIVALGLAFL